MGLFSSIAGPVAGALTTGLFGQYSNIQSLDESARNREWQEYMSGTAHQREVQDLRAAGLNPILSAYGRGATTPTGSQASISDLGQAVATGANSGVAYKQMVENLKKTKAETRRIEAEAKAKELPAEYKSDIKSGYQGIKRFVRDLFVGAFGSKKEADKVYEKLDKTALGKFINKHKEYEWKEVKKTPSKKRPGTNNYVFQRKFKGIKMPKKYVEPYWPGRKSIEEIFGHLKRAKKRVYR